MSHSKYRSFNNFIDTQGLKHDNYNEENNSISQDRLLLATKSPNESGLQFMMDSSNDHL